MSVCNRTDIINSGNFLGTRNTDRGKSKSSHGKSNGNELKSPFGRQSSTDSGAPSASGGAIPKLLQMRTANSHSSGISKAEQCSQISNTGSPRESILSVVSGDSQNSQEKFLLPNGQAEHGSRKLPDYHRCLSLDTGMATSRAFSTRHESVGTCLFGDQTFLFTV